MKTQASLLDDLAWRRQPPEEIIEALQPDCFGTECEVYTLTMAAILDAIDACLAGKLQEKDLAEWARFFESYEQVGYEEPLRDTIADVLFRLGNPEFAQPLTKETLLDIRSLCTQGR